MERVCNHSDRRKLSTYLHEGVVFQLKMISKIKEGFFIYFLFLEYRGTLSFVQSWKLFNPYILPTLG